MTKPEPIQLNCSRLLGFDQCVDHSGTTIPTIAAKVGSKDPTLRGVSGAGMTALAVKVRSKNPEAGGFPRIGMIALGAKVGIKTK